MMKKCLIVIFILLPLICKAQDPEFSQYYAAPLYLNPAFAGTTFDHRFMANYRNQWPTIAQGYVTSAFSYDYNLLQYNSGVGFMAVLDKAGSAGLKSNQLNFLYSYRLHVANKWVIASGLNFGYAFRSIDFSKLLFGDQLQFDADGQAPSDDPTLYNLGMAHYFDFKAGILAYNKSFWFGFAANHLNRPNRSLVNEESTLPIKMTVHGGVRIPLNRGSFKNEQESVFSPSFVYKRQGNFDQLDIGASFLYDPISFGVWYRGIPVTQNVKDNISQDAVVAILGFQFEKVEVAYSYDFTVSELGPISGGAHEISLKYKLAINMHSKSKRKEKLIPCPTFNR